MTMLRSHLASKHKLTKGGSVPGQVDQLKLTKNGGRLIAHSLLDSGKQTRLLSKLVNWIVDDN